MTNLTHTYFIIKFIQKKIILGIFKNLVCTLVAPEVHYLKMINNNYNNKYNNNDNDNKNK